MKITTRNSIALLILQVVLNNAVCITETSQEAQQKPVSAQSKRTFKKKPFKSTQDIYENIEKVIKENNIELPKKVIAQLYDFDPLADDVDNEHALAHIIQLIITSGKKSFSPEQVKELSNLRQELINKLKSYKVTGWCQGFAVDPNLAFFYNNQNPSFTVNFKNKDGEFKQKTYETNITSWGFKIQFSINIDGIFFVGTDANFYEMNKTIEFGTGIDITFPLFPANPANNVLAALSIINLTYAPFKNTPGGILIIGKPFGLGGIGLGVVTGGFIKPVE